MDTIADYFEQAQLSMAAYAPSLLSGAFGSQNPDYVTSLKLAGMSQKQAEEFANAYTVVDQYTDPTGFSGTVFSKGGVNYLAIRGSENVFTGAGAIDWFGADFDDIGTEGIAISQGLAMFNWVQRLYGTPGSAVVQYTYNANGTISTFTDTATGELNGQPTSLSVTGHSLGGHLAMMLGRMAPGLFNNVYTYNAPGFDVFGTGLTSAGFFDVLSNAPAPLTGAIGADWNTNGIINTNVEGDAVHGAGFVPGKSDIVFSESANQGIIDAHSIKALTDALAVYDVLGSLDATLGLNQITPFLEAGSNKPNESLEAIVNAVGDLVGAGTKIAIDDRNALYTRLQAIDQVIYQDPAAANPILNPVYQNLHLTAVNALSGDATLDTANGLAYRYALEQLNPFALTGNAGLYAAQNGNGELNADQFTQHYLDDRAHMLSQLISRNVSDAVLVTNGQFSNEVYEDLGRNIIASTLGVAGPSAGRPDTAVQYVFGGDAGEVIPGGQKADHLYGGGGDDTLEGKGGDDYLEGGSGNDTYIFNAGDGFDTLFDSDGLGSITVRSGTGTTTLGGTLDSIPGATDLYEDSDKNRYAKTGNDLLITLKDGGGRILVKKFTDGQLGISLNAVAAPAASQAPDGTQFFELGQPGTGYNLSPTVGGHSTIPAYGPGPWDPYLTEVISAIGVAGPVEDVLAGITGTVAGGLGDSYIQGDAGFNLLMDDLYTTIPFELGIPNPLDWLSGDPVFEARVRFDLGFFSLANRVGNDVMRGGGGNDWLLSHGGDDWLYGDAGNDLLLDDPGLTPGDNRWLALPGASSDDRLFGGTGDDVLISQQGKDYLDGGEGNDTLLSGQGDDTLSGGAGNDFLLADTALNRFDFVRQPDGSFKTVLVAADETVDYGKDTLFGGAGNDDLAGGGSDDFLLGGSGNDTLWGDGNGTLDANGIIRITVGDGTRAGNDTLFGEQGDDTLLGGGGDDYLDGGAGNDQLDGDQDGLDILYHGDDTLFGGDGDDVLVGNGGNDMLSGDAGNDRLSGDEGNDRLSGGVGMDTLQGGDGNDVLSGGAGDDTLAGDAGQDRVTGGAGNDQLQGGAGDDMLDGGVGADQLFGDAGADTFVFHAGDGVDTIGDADGADRIRMADVRADAAGVRSQTNGAANYLVIDYGAGDAVFIQNGNAGSIAAYEFAGGQRLDVAGRIAQGIDYNGSAGADTITGGIGNDSVFGYAGDDTLDGGAGNDTLAGGTGNDTYIVDVAGDRVQENAAAGIDTVAAAVSWTLGANVEQLVLMTGAAALTGKGNAADNRIQGNTAANTLSGLAGDDVLLGMRGDDTLQGGAGRDQLYGDLGNDQLDGGRSDDQLNGGAGDDVYTFSIGDGQDRIIDAEGVNTIRFGAGVTAASLSVEQFQSDDGAFYLRINYGAGDSIAIKNGFAGRISDYRFADGTRLSHTELVGSAPIPLQVKGTVGDDVITGTDKADKIDGLAGNDTLSGAAGDDRLNGGGGDDTLDGGSGADTLDGGTGNDSLAGGAGEDRYRVRWGMGLDTVLESDGGRNILALDEGIALADLSVIHEGADVVVRLRGSADGLRIPGGASGSQVWRVETAQGSGDALLNLLDQPVVSDTIGSAINTYKTRVRGLVFSTLGSQGYRRSAGGVFSRNESQVGFGLMTTRHFNDRYSVQIQTGDAPTMVRRSPDYQRTDTLLNRRQSTMFQGAVTAGGNALSTFGPGRFIPAGQTAGVELPFGSAVIQISGNVLDSDPTQNLSLTDYNDLFDNKRLLGYWLYGAGASGNTASAGLKRRTVTRQEIQVDSRQVLEEINAGVSANTISTRGYSVIDAGAGDDVVSVTGRTNWERNYGLGYYGFASDPFSYDGPPDPRNIGAFLYGNAGNDTLLGGASDDVLSGGDGFDFVDGGGGADTYLVLANGNGTDVIGDGGTIEDPFSDVREQPEINRYTTWYYQTLGITDWQDRLSRDEPLPSLPPNMARNDYAALQPLADAGVYAKDTVEFGGDIRLADLVLSWGELVPNTVVPVGESVSWPEGDQVHTTLDISVVNGRTVRIIIPHALNGIQGSAPGDSADPGQNADIGYLSAVTNYLGLGIEQFKFSDGSVLTMQEMMALIAGPTPSFDPQDGDNRITATPGDDIFSGAGGNDTIDGGAGNDRLSGDAGNDTLMGGAGDDTLVGGTGRDVLNGGDGNDIFTVAGTDTAYDTFNGGAGTDTIVGGYGDDTIRLHDYRSANTVEIIDGGGGTNVIAGTSRYDIIALNATVLKNIDRIDAGAGNDRVTGSAGADVIVGGSGQDRLNGMAGDDTFIVEGTDSAYDLFNGGSGTDTLQGGAGDDTLRLHYFRGRYSVEVIDGRAGRNVIAGTGRRDTLDFRATTILNIDRIDAGGGNDTVMGSAGADVIVGGTGNDSLNGGAGNDRYLFSRGDGNDRISDIEVTPNTDNVVFEPGINHDQLWFSQVGNDLDVQVIGTSDRVVVNNWYAGPESQIEVFQAGDGLSLLNSQVDQLVQAMAAFTPPASGVLDLSPTVQSRLDPVLAANWQ